MILLDHIRCFFLSSRFSRVLVSVLCSSPVIRCLIPSSTSFIFIIKHTQHPQLRECYIKIQCQARIYTHSLHKLPAICSKTYLFTQQNHFHSLTHHFVVIVDFFFNFTLFCATLTIFKTNINAFVPFLHTLIQCTPCGSLVGGVFVLFAYGLFSF